VITTKRRFLKYLIFSILTLGIYSIYFWWLYVRDLNIVCQDYGKRSPSFIVLLLLSIVTFGVYYFVWMYQQGQRMKDAGKKLYNIDIEESGSTYIFWFFIGFLLCGLGPFFTCHFLIANLNALAIEYNKRIPS